MKRLLLNGLVTAFLVFFVYGVAQAQPNLTLPNVIGVLGGSVGVPLNFSNNGQVTTAQMDILFDNSIVSINPDVDLNPSGQLSSAGFTVQANDIAGGIRIVIFNLGDPAALIPTGDLLDMNFSADQEGSTNLEFNNVLFGDAGGMPVPVDILTDGSIEVQAAPPGEINVTIKKSADTNRVDPGVPALITYEITLEGVGDPDGVATDVIVTDELPSGAVFQAADSSQECQLLLGANTVECDVSNIGDGDIVVLGIVISITRDKGDNIINQAIVDFLNGFGEPVQNDSNTVTVKVGGGGGGGSSGCALAASSGNTGGIGSMGLFALLLVPGFTIGLRRLIKKNSK
jgi:hypothetical protein